MSPLSYLSLRLHEHGAIEQYAWANQGTGWRKCEWKTDVRFELSWKAARSDRERKGTAAAPSWRPVYLVTKRLSHLYGYNKFNSRRRMSGFDIH
jgi:hypothetical protein